MPISIDAGFAMLDWVLRRLEVYPRVSLEWKRLGCPSEPSLKTLVDLEMEK